MSAAKHWRPGRGIVQDVQRRLPHYRNDWMQGLNWGTRILPPSTYIFFASVLPALAFGQQLATSTDGTLNVVHVLVSTALAGITQSLIGGQPLLIIGVAEPIVIIYGFMYAFAKTAPGLGVGLFLPWAAWVCIWTALMCCVLAVLGASEGIKYFTRFSGELFGALIAILFLQVGIKGIVHEFYPADPAPPAAAEPWTLTLINGLWSLLLSLALLLSCLHILKARSWRLGRGWLRGLLADYGVPLMVVLWSGVSFAVTPAPHVPRRVATPNTWQVRDTWAVAGRLGDVPGSYIGAALVPAIIVTVLFYFDHNVSSQMAQQPEFHLVKGPAYHWDFLLLSALTLVCGLLGLPPVNGVLPQAPMHIRSLAHIPKRYQQKHAAAHTRPGDAALTVNGTSDESEWTADSYNAAPARQVPAVAAVTQSLSKLRLGRGTEAAWQELSTGAQAQHMQQPPEGVHAVTAALSHMHLDTPGHFHENSSPFGTPKASASLDPGRQYSQQAGSASSSPSAEHNADGAVLRHRQRSLSPSGSQGVNTAAGSSAPQQRRVRPSLELQQQQRAQGRGRLHPSGSDMAINTLPDSAAAELSTGIGAREADGGLGPPAEQGSYLRLEVREQRVSNMLQSLLVAACLGITPAIQQIPTGVLWGYFIFMAVESLAGSQLWERLLLLATDPKKRLVIMQQDHAAYMQVVPYAVVVRFTLLQVVYLLGVWALTTWAGIAGIAFPVPIMALVPIRQFLLPRLFDRGHLSQLDAAEYEEAPAVLDKLRAAQELFELGAITEAPAPHLPVTAAGPSSGEHPWDEDEAEVVSKEFHGLQIKHHLTRESVELQQQQLRRRLGE